MQDHYHRDISYLRISITDRCNMRCIYCMPEEGVELNDRQAILSFEELYKIVEASTDVGIRKVRITGGEPLVRKGVIEFIEKINSIPQIDDIAITTNGLLLEEMIKDLKAAGLKRVNLSLDTLKPDRFKAITRTGNLDKVWAGIEAALREGLKPVKINMVAMKGINDDEIEAFAKLTNDYDLHVRYIEIMPIGTCDSWAQERHIPIKEIQQRIETKFGKLIKYTKDISGAGPAKYYALDNAKGSLGFISAISSHFCESCNRLRLTSEGKLRPCLHGKREIDIKTALRNGANREELVQLFRQAIDIKPKQHSMVDDGWADNSKVMSQIGG